MKIEIAASGTSGLTQVKLSHAGQESFWDVRPYARTSGQADALDTSKLFDEINGYWASLPAQRQELIWQTYQQIKEVLDHDWEILTVQRRLVQPVKQLYDLMPWNEIRHWATFHSKVRLPSTLKDQYDPLDPPDRTYLRADYQELVVLAVALRPMVPIWGEFIAATRRETGTVLKEYIALKLLYDTWLVTCQPMERLRQYVVSSVQHAMEPGPSPTAILGGLGTEELPEWILAQTVVRRLSTCEISSQDDSSHLISNVYQYVNSQLKHKSMDRRFESKFGGKVSDKNQPGSTGEDANSSFVEMYKVKQEIDDGALVTVNVYTEDPFRMAAQIDPEIEPDRLNECLRCVTALEAHPIARHQITLCQWAISKVLSPKAVPHMTKPALLRSIAVTQAMLWRWGFNDLAALSTATPLAADGDVMIGAMGNWPKISKEIMDELMAAYPHYQLLKGKQISVRQQNPAARAADLFCEMVTYNDWQLHAPQQLVDTVPRIGNSRRMIVPSDIRNQVAKLFLHLARR